MRTLRNDLDLAVSLVDRLDLAVEHDQSMAHGIASDLEATIVDAECRTNDQNVLDVLNSIRHDVAMIRSMMETADRPTMFQGTLSDLLDHAYMGIIQIHANVTGCRLNSCSIPSF